MIAGKNIGVWLLVLMFAILLVASGCSDEEAPPLTPVTEVIIPNSSLPVPGSPEQLMANFQVIYETRDSDEYKLILDPAFETILQRFTTNEFPDVGTTLDVTEELRIHERMFSGEDVTDPQGELVPGVLNISFSTFQASEAWTMMPPGDTFPNAEWAPFDVVFLFDRGQAYLPLNVTGTIKFYVTSRDSLHQGETKQYYQMIGQVDLTNLDKGIGPISWGSVKALFR